MCPSIPKRKKTSGIWAQSGQTWRPKKTPTLVKTHDFPDRELGKASPYGVCDIGENEGLVNVGIDHDTALFAVHSIRSWWDRIGKSRYPEAKSLYLTADCGGGHSARSRLWKQELQRFADETGLEIQVSHYPPGTSKWNNVEHFLFNHITSNWRGQPLVDTQTVLNLIRNTTTATGLHVECLCDRYKYSLGEKVTDEEMKQLNLRGDSFHPEWNYRILPKNINP